MKEAYTPTQVDIQWAKNMLSLITNGGALAYPATLLIYQVDHTNKELRLQNPSVLEDVASRETHDRTIVVMDHVGYAVK